MAECVFSNIAAYKAVVIHPKAHHGHRTAVWLLLFIKRCIIVHAENEIVLCMENIQLCSSAKELVSSSSIRRVFLSPHWNFAQATFMNVY